MKPTIDSLSAALERACDKNSKILYFKERNGDVINIQVRNKGFFSSLFAPRGYSRFRGDPAKVAEKVNSLVQKLLTSNFQNIEQIEANLKKFQTRLSKKNSSLKNYFDKIIAIKKYPLDRHFEQALIWGDTDFAPTERLFYFTHGTQLLEKGVTIEEMKDSMQRMLIVSQKTEDFLAEKAKQLTKTATIQKNKQLWEGSRASVIQKYPLLPDTFDLDPANKIFEQPDFLDAVEKMAAARSEEIEVNKQAFDLCQEYANELGFFDLLKHVDFKITPIDVQAFFRDTLVPIIDDQFRWLQMNGAPDAPYTTAKEALLNVLNNGKDQAGVGGLKGQIASLFFQKLVQDNPNKGWLKDIRLDFTIGAVVQKHEATQWKELLSKILKDIADAAWKAGILERRWKDPPSLFSIFG